MPTCVFRVVVQLVLHIPAQDAITKPRCTRRYTLEFINTDVLTAKDTIDVCKSKLYTIYTFALVLTDQIVC